MRAILPWLLALALLVAIGLAMAEDAQDARIGEVFPLQTTYLESSPGLKFGSFVNCARYRVPAASRIRNIHKAAHVGRVDVIPAPLPAVQFSSPKIQVCFHQNTSLGLCQCSKDSWKSLEKGRVSSLKSLFQASYVDIRGVGSITDIPVVVSSREEFCLYRVVFFVLGVFFLLVAPVVSEWVPFYYSSAMTLGIFLVVFLFLFQAMKLLPTGRKSSLYILLYGSVVGLGTVIIRYVASLLAPFLLELGLGEDMLKPVAVLSLLGIVIMGAWLGYWGVRKFLLTDEGEVDSGTSEFVKWAIRLVGGVLLLQSSYDPIFAILSLVVGVSISLLKHIPLPSLDEFSWPWLNRDSYAFDSSLYRKKQTRRWRMKQATGSPYAVGASTSYRSPVSVSGKRVFVSPPGRFRFTPDSDFYSTFHDTPERGMSRAQYDAVSRECTLNCMEELVASPEFAGWVNANVDRISVLPNEEREERTAREIQMTANMDTNISHRLQRY